MYAWRVPTCVQSGPRTELVGGDRASPGVCLWGAHRDRDRRELPGDVGPVLHLLHGRRHLAKLDTEGLRSFVCPLMS